MARRSGVKVPGAMMGALWVLAVPTALVGFLLFAHLAPLEGARVDVVTAFTGSLLSLAGIGWGLTPVALGARDVADAIPAPVRGFLLAGYRLDDVQDWLVVRPVRALARLVARADRDVIDAPIRGSATATGWAGRGVGRLSGSLVTSFAAWAIAGAVIVGVIGVVLS
jgi:NADH-quinone oxidoreductase subunit L